MPFVRAGALNVYYDISGPRDAPAIVFANSLVTNVHVWDAQAAALAQRRRVVRYDTRGHGLTAPAPPGEGYGIEQLADDLALLLEALGIRRASVAGLSLGGMVAQRFAAEYPDRVDALVLCATNSRIGTQDRWNTRIALIEREGMTAVTEGILAGWFTPPTHAAHPELIDGYRTMLERTPVTGYIGCAAAVRDADLRDDDARITAPTLVVLGAEDPTCPPAGDELTTGIRGARLVVVQNAAHLLSAEKPDEVIRTIEQFIQSATTSGSAV